MQLVEAGGATIPALGFGTWRLSGDLATAMVEQALALGYRHIDTARMYANEAEVGAGVRASGLPRGDVFVTTKIWPDDFRRADFKVAVERSLDSLKLGWVDLLLLHWPSATVPLAETMAMLDEVKELGLARHIGVSNFTVRLLQEARALARSPLVCNQVEYHPFISQNRLLAWQRANGVALTAYSPVARGKVIGEPVIEAIARHHGRSALQVTLRWLIQQKGVIAIPRTSKPENAKANLEAQDFELSAEEMQAISALGSPAGRMVHGAHAPEWDAD